MANLEKKLRTRIAQKFDLVENWEASSLVLLRGELAIDELNRIKIGTGDKTWSELPFAVDGNSAAIQVAQELPSLEDIEVGNLAVVDGKLYAAVPDGENGKKWADLTNADDIASLQSALVALKSDVDAKDAAHDAAIVALQASISSDLQTELDAIKDDVAANAGSIAENRADLDGILDANDSTKIKAAALPSEIYVDGKINSAALPSFVDDVVEGLVCVSDSDADATFTMTHNDGAVIGFFGASGAEEGATRALKLVSAATPAESNLSAVSYTENGITYNFPESPVANKVAPSSSVIYVDVRTNKSYRWSGSQFVVVAGDLALGTTASSAFYGDRGLALEQEVFGDANADPEKVGLVARTETLEQDLDALEETVATEVSSLNAAVVALKADCDSKHSDLEDEIAASIVALKQESEQADAAHEASLVALQQQVDALNATTSAMNINDVIANSTPANEGDPLNAEVLVLECGGAE